MEKKSRDTSCSKDIFKARQRGPWATLGRSGSFDATLSTISNSSGPRDEEHLLGDTPAQPYVTYCPGTLSPEPNSWQR